MTNLVKDKWFIVDKGKRMKPAKVNAGTTAVASLIIQLRNQNGYCGLLHSFRF